MQFVFIVCLIEGYRNILKLSCRLLAFTSYKALLKNKNRSGTSIPAPFSASFLKKKYFSYNIMLPDQISLSGCLYFVRYWTICVLQLVVNRVVTSQILKLTFTQRKTYLYVLGKCGRRIYTFFNTLQFYSL